MTRYRKKPVEIEAHVWWPNDEQSAGYVVGWIGANGGQTRIVRGMGDSSVLGIETLEGVMECSPGDFVIRGVQGQFYPCKPDIFAATYDPVDAT